VNWWTADIAVIARDRKSKTHRGDAEARRKAGRAYRGFTRMIADQKIRTESEALAPKSERVDERFFQPGTEAALGGFVGFGVVDLEQLF